MIRIKRAYEQSSSADGLRILVDRLWPRGLTKQELSIDEWAKELSPSDALRCWFAHEPKRWKGFLSKYFRELDQKQSSWEPLLKKSKRRTVTLVYGAKDTEHNNAEALREYLVLKAK